MKTMPLTLLTGLAMAFNASAASNLSVPNSREILTTFLTQIDALVVKNKAETYSNLSVKQHLDEALSYPDSSLSAGCDNFRKVSENESNGVCYVAVTIPPAAGEEEGGAYFRFQFVYKKVQGNTDVIMNKMVRVLQAG